MRAFHVQILVLAVDYAARRSNSLGLSKKKKSNPRSWQGRRIFKKRRKCQVKLMTTVEEQRQILESCHSDPTFEHFGTTGKTEWMAFVAENGLRSDFRVSRFHGGSVPQISQQMRVTHVLGAPICCAHAVPMLCPSTLLDLATPQHHLAIFAVFSSLLPL